MRDTKLYPSLQSLKILRFYPSDAW